MKALILDNKVVDVASAEFEVAPTMTWVDCSDEVQTGWSYVNSTFSPPPGKSEAEELAWWAKEIKKKLTQTDWAMLPDVNISNRAEFEEYREIIRNLYLNPVINPELPPMPEPVWI